MSFLVKDIIRDAREIYDGLAPDDAVRHLNRVRATVLSELDLRKTSTTIDVTDGTIEYALASTALKVDAVDYVRSSSERDFKPLRPTSVDELDTSEAEWRRLDPSEPDRFYLSVGTTGPVIGLVPPPNETTSSSYPHLKVYFSQNETLTANSTIYDDLPSTSVYVYGIAKEHAVRYDKENFANFRAMYEMELAAAQRYLYNKTARNQGARFIGAWRRRTGVI